MRLSTSLALALPVLGVSAEGAFEQYKAKFQNFLGQFGASIPGSAPAAETVPPKGTEAAPKAAVPAKPIEVFTMENWKDTLYGPVKPEALEPEEWWVMVTGRNKTCWGRCEQAEAAWNETAPKLAALANSLHLGFLNCEDNALLCTVWSCSAPSIWTFKMLPAPAPVEIVIKRLSHNTTTPQTIMDLYEEGYVKGNKEGWKVNESVFHPFNGKFAELGLSVPFAYVIWFFTVVPNWAVMLVVSFISRSMMNRRMQPPPAAQAARRGAPAGDAAGPR